MMDTQQAYAELYLIPGAPPQVIEAAYWALRALYASSQSEAGRSRLAAVIAAYQVIQQHRGEEGPVRLPTPISPREIGQDERKARIHAIIEEQGRRARKRMEPFKSIENLKRNWEDE